MPVRADADQIIAAYLTFAKKHIEVESNPDNPDWAGLLSLIVPKIQAEARAEITEHFNKGETLNTSLGVTFNPRLSRLRYPDDYIELIDCRVDGSYWVVKATGQPAAGELAEVRQRRFNAELEQHGGVWQMIGYGYASGAC